MPRDAALIADLKGRIAAIESGAPAQSSCDSARSCKAEKRKRSAALPVETEPHSLEVPAGERVTKRASGKPAKEFDPGDANAAFKKIVDILNAADKSEKALRARLAHIGYAQVAIDESVQRARAYGFIDDMRYAEVLIRSRRSQGKGSAGIERELKEHDIDPYELAGWPEAFGISYDDELDRAVALLERNPPRAKNKRDAAYRKLVQKGYPSSIATSATRIFCERAC